jgi:phosphoribosyl 1,2-cyclic phosphodiesterase
VVSAAATVEFFGVRGSLPTPGPDTIRYGGNTSCVAVWPRDDHLVVLDAGSGIRPLSAAVGSQVARVDILLSHLHMDHIQGLGFFGPLYCPGLEVHVWGPRSAVHVFRERITRYLSAPLFPVHLWDLPSKLWIHDTPLDVFEVGDVQVAAELVCHPGSTVGYRLEVGGAVLAYLPDHEPALATGALDGAAEWRSGNDLAAGADLLVHDAQYDSCDYELRVGWGHSSIAQSLAFGRAVGARRVVPFHFDPAYHDERLDDLLARETAQVAAGIDVVPAREGLTLSLERSLLV